MKSDNSRNTFDARKHFSSVRMQQGRVQIDADSNEQIDIVNHRIDTEAGDVIGLCGAPMHDPGFHIFVRAVANLSSEGGEKGLKERNTLPPDAFKVPFAAQNFWISAGRYYVDGILCENEKTISYLNQPDLPDATPIAERGVYVVYLDVWERLLTALDDPSIREIALGGPDTATRARTVWQVKHLLVDSASQPPITKPTSVDTSPVGTERIGTKPADTVTVPVDTKPVDTSRPLGGMTNINCLTKVQAYEDLIAASTAKLSARSKPAQATTDPCIVPPGAGYTGLENQLYRVEIHRGGEALDVNAGGTGTLPATFKWSRDNGVVVTTIQSIDKTRNELTVHDLGPDDALGFKEGQWVEISDDGLELNGLPGQLARITKIDSAINVITLNATPSLTLNPDRHPKVRRWDGTSDVKYDSNASHDYFLDLESGVQVRFFEGRYKSGDYWTVPARTATADTQSGNIEWPLDESSQPLAQSPFGIKHHYCRLAMLRWLGERGEGEGRRFLAPLVIEDCRRLFPPVTELTSMFYVSGDGQEAMPDLTQPLLPLVPRPLEKPLVVGVSNGQWPVKNARVRFQIVAGGGSLAPHTPQVGGPSDDAKTINILTDEQGLAACDWLLDSNMQSQQVEATLRAVSDPNANPNDPADHAVGLPIKLTANLSFAGQVAYDPGTCGTLKDQGNVQLALDRLSQLMSLHKISGDGQDVMPGELPAPLRVLVADRCGPITDPNFKVNFRIVEPGEDAGARGKPGSGALSNGGIKGAKSIDIKPKDGFWTCNWTPDPNISFQEVEASIKDDITAKPEQVTSAPTKVRFSLNLSKADHVFYDPGQCRTLQDQKTMQAALDRLSQLRSIHKISGDGQVIIPNNPLALRVLVASPCGPVSDPKFKVTFKIVTDGAKGSLTEPKLKDGFWTCNWTPDPSVPFQEVEASIKDVGNVGDVGSFITTPPTTVRFSATLGSPKEDPVIKITKISSSRDNNELQNDTLVPVSRLTEGIGITCSGPIAPESVGGPPNPPTILPVAAKPTCFVTLDLPYPLVDADQSFWKTPAVIGFQPLILRGTVSVTNSPATGEIRWLPTRESNNWLKSFLFARTGTFDRVLAHLTLKGNFIFSENLEMSLDGDAFGVPVPQRDRVDLRFPTGDGRTGGDFEMWFWLTPALILNVRVTGVQISSTIDGSVLNASGDPVTGAQIKLTPPTGAPQNAVTRADGSFQFRLVVPVVKGNYDVTASIDDVSVGKQITV